MKENEWISVDDSLPGVNKKIEVKAIDKNGNEYFGNAKAKRDTINLVGFYILFDTIGMGRRADAKLTHWRYPIEKRPDFSKLEKGDFLILHLLEKDKVGFFFRIDKDGDIITSYLTDLIGPSWTDISSIKKITRINLEKQTFEEI